MSAIDEIRAERQRQIESEGWTPAHDAHHIPGTLAVAGACYANMAGLRLHSDDGPLVDTSKHVCPELSWPFEREWWKPKNVRRDLIRAAALIVAEIDRLDRDDGPDMQHRD